MGDLKDKIIWITGAGTGIGEAAALAFAADGAKLALFGRRASMLEGVAGKAKAAGAEVEICAVDVADREAVNSTAKRLLDKWKRVDVLVNNAGLNIPNRRLEDMGAPDWDLVVNVNLTGAYNMIAAVLPPMRAQQDGLIVNVSSMAAKQASGLSGAAYTASKHGMNGLSLSVSAEEWKNGIRATALCPGEVDTPILEKRPVKVEEADRARMAKSEDLAAAIRFLALLPARVTVPEMLMVPTWRRQFKPGETG